jgi:UDP-N-acetylmuramoyl-tripeptide--D-alanyl-D-alanine ligase
VGRRTLILGAMKELGATSESLHREMGSYAKAAGIEEFWGVGEELKSAVEAFGKTGRYFSNRERAIKALPNAFSQGDVVLMKGSRSVGMEVLLNALRDNDFGGEG